MHQPTLTKTTSVGATQKIYRFANGYGASVIQGLHTYGGDQGLWELAVTHYPKKDSDVFNLTYETPITSDVIGYLTEQEVEDLLTQIEALAPATTT